MQLSTNLMAMPAFLQFSFAIHHFCIHRRYRLKSTGVFYSLIQFRIYAFSFAVALKQQARSSEYIYIYILVFNIIYLIDFHIWPRICIQCINGSNRGGALRAASENSSPNLGGCPKGCVRGDE